MIPLEIPPPNRPRSPSPVLPSLSLSPSKNTANNWDLDTLFQNAIQPQSPRHPREMTHGPQSSKNQSTGFIETKDHKHGQQRQSPITLNTSLHPPQGLPVEQQQDMFYSEMGPVSRQYLRDDNAVFHMGPPGMTTTSFALPPLNIRQYETHKKTSERDILKVNVSAPPDTPPDSPPETHPFKQYNPSTKAFDGSKIRPRSKEKTSLDFILLDFPKAVSPKMAKVSPVKEPERITSNAWKITDKSVNSIGGQKALSKEVLVVAEKPDEVVQKRSQNVELNEPRLAAIPEVVEDSASPARETAPSNEQSLQTKVHRVDMEEIQETDHPSEGEIVKPSEPNVMKALVGEPVSKLLPGKTEHVLDTEMTTAEVIDSSNGEKNEPEVQNSAEIGPVSSVDGVSEETLSREDVESSESDQIPSNTINESMEIHVDPQPMSDENVLPRSGKSTASDSIQSLPPRKEEQRQTTPQTPTAPDTSSDIRHVQSIPYRQGAQIIAATVPSGPSSPATTLPAFRNSPIPTSASIEKPSPLKKAHASAQQREKPNSLEVVQDLVPLKSPIPHWPIPETPIPEDHESELVQLQTSISPNESAPGSSVSDSHVPDWPIPACPSSETAQSNNVVQPAEHTSEEFAFTSPSKFDPDVPMPDSDIPEASPSKDDLQPMEETFQHPSSSAESSSGDDPFDETDELSQPSTSKSLRFKVRFSESPTSDEPPSKRQKLPDRIIHDCIVVRTDWENVPFLSFFY